jgi:transposase
MITELSPSVLIGSLVPVLPSSILEPLWVQVAALLPTRGVCDPLGCHRPRIPDRIVFDKLIQVLVFGCGYRRTADATYSATTLRRRRDEWIRAGVAERPRLAVLAAYDRLFGLDVEQLADGIPLGAVPAAANRHRRRAALGDPGHLGSGQHRDREATAEPVVHLDAL